MLKLNLGGEGISAHGEHVGHALSTFRQTTTRPELVEHCFIWTPEHFEEWEDVFSTESSTKTQVLLFTMLSEKLEH